jgi:hypothetical protein
MRHALAVLAVTTGVAHADSGWSEYSVADQLRPATQLVESGCDMAVELRGAIAEVTVQQKLTNPGPTALAAMTELELPAGAQLIGVTAQRGRGKAASAISVPSSVSTLRVDASSTITADPVLVTALPSRDTRARFRVVVQPLEAEQELTVGTRWTAVAELREGAIKLVLPGRRGDLPCHGIVHVATGPGASIDRIRVGATDAGTRSTATFDHGKTDTVLSAVLAFRKQVPVVWTQSQSLGDGWSAQAITVVTPVVRSVSARRALLMVDGSRSMELVGRHNVKRLVREIGSALPSGAEIEAIVFDRTPRRVLGSWKPATAETVASIEQAIAGHPAGNGTDPLAALTLARQAIGDARTQTLVMWIGDGVIGEVTSKSLVDALGGDPKTIDVHAIALAPGRMAAPAATVLRAFVGHYGGSHAEVPTANVDAAIAQLDQWLRPAWLDLSLGSDDFSPGDQLRAGTGIVSLAIVKKPTKLTLTGRADAPIKVASAAAPTAPLAQLALAGMALDGVASTAAARLRIRHPAVDDDRALLVLATGGAAATHRRAMIDGGGPIVRMVDLPDPEQRPLVAVGVAMPLGGSALDRQLIQLLLRTHLQPAAFACYQRALATDGKLAGTARFTLEIGRGELTRAQVAGIGEAAFDSCLLDAAYKVTPPLPNPDYNTDDRTIVNYPLTFSVREQKPFVVAGDADSSSPLDIDAIQGGPPTPPKGRGPIKAGDTSTPLGGLRPAKSP